MSRTTINWIGAIRQVGASVQVQTVSFADEPMAAAFPGAEVYLSGSVTVDFPEEVAIALQPNRLQMMSVSGATVTFNLVEGKFPAACGVRYGYE